MTEGVHASASAWSATRSWAPRTRRPGAPPAVLRPAAASAHARGRGRDEAAVGAAADGLGWARRRPTGALLARDDVGLVDVCTPGDTHAEIAIAALEAGKHVLCEKPLANTVAEAEAMVARRRGGAARGVRAMVGFTYRRVPAIALARSWSREGRIGKVRHVRAQYLQDWIADPQAPMSWRLRQAEGGLRGARGHRRARRRPGAVRHGRVASRGSRRSLETFVQERPVAGRRPAGCTAGGRRRTRARSRWTTPRCSSAGCPAGGWRRSRRPGSPGAARTRSGWRSTGRTARWPSTSRT